MQESLRPLRDPRLDQAAILCDLIKDIRRILVQPVQNHVKLSAIQQAVDELAPPPPPEIGQEHQIRLAGALAGRPPQPLTPGTPAPSSPGP